MDFSNQAGKGIMKARILAHRGLWVTDSEKNSKEAIALALSEGFGVELDVRDRNGGLIVSHDPSAESCPLILNELAADLDASPTSWITPRRWSTFSPVETECLGFLAHP